MKIEVGATNLETNGGGEARILMIDGDTAFGVLRTHPLTGWFSCAWNIHTGKASDFHCMYDLREKTPEWYENIHHTAPIPCWVGDRPNPTSKDDLIDFIRGYRADDTYSFKGVQGDYRYATPIKPSECWGYKGEGK